MTSEKSPNILCFVCGEINGHHTQCQKLQDKVRNQTIADVEKIIDKWDTLKESGSTRYYNNLDLEELKEEIKNLEVKA